MGPRPLPELRVRSSRQGGLTVNADRVTTTARLAGRGDGTVGAVLKAPKSAQYVTLRVQAEDSRGNTVTQTVVRAAGIAR
ncbi:hypothetical protein [Streptomyces sp. NPDC055681]